MSNEQTPTQGRDYPGPQNYMGQCRYCMEDYSGSKMDTSLGCCYACRTKAAQPPTPTPDDVDAAVLLIRGHVPPDLQRKCAQQIAAALAQAREAGRREAGEDTARNLKCIRDIQSDFNEWNVAASGYPESELIDRIANTLLRWSQQRDAARTAMEGGVT